jgi:hypothetical protein
MVAPLSTSTNILSLDQAESLSVPGSPQPDLSLEHCQASWRQGVFSDWMVVLGSRRFQVHRYQLAVGPQSSAFFFHEFQLAKRLTGQTEQRCTRIDLARSLLCQGCSTARCTCSSTLATEIDQLNDEFADGFELVLEHLYEGTFRPSEATLLVLWRLVDFLQIPALIKQLEAYFERILSPVNAACFLVECQRLGFNTSSSVLQRCFASMCAHFQEYDPAQLRLLTPTLLRALLLEAQHQHVSPVVLSRVVLGYLRPAGQEPGELSSSSDNENQLSLLIGLSPYLTNLSAADAAYVLRQARTLAAQPDRLATVAATAELEVDEILPRIAELTQKCLDSLALHFDEMESEEFNQLSPEMVLHLLGSDHLQISHEDEVFQLVKSYIEASRTPALRNQQIEQLWSTCRFAFLSSTCLVEALATPSLPTQLVASGAIAAKMLTENTTNNPQAVAVQQSARRVPCFDEHSSSSLLTMSNKQRTAKLTGTAVGHHNAFSRQVVSWSASGTASFYWEFELPSNIKSLQGMYVGVVKASEISNNASQAHIGSSSLSSSWGLQLSSGKKIHAGKSSSYAPSSGTQAMARGDTIGMLLERSDRPENKLATLTFYRNGKSLGQAFSRIEGDIAPAVTLYRRDQAVTLSYHPRWIPKQH